MRRYIYSLLLILCSVSLLADNIKFMTYNLETDKFLNFQSSRINRQAQVISASNADVVAVQEVKGSSNFNKLKTNSGLSGSWFDIAGNGYGIGVLWKQSLGTPTITNIKFNPLPGSTDPESRAYIIAEFADFAFISTHFGLNADDRDVITASIINYANNAGKTVFVGGDFNAQPNYRAMVTFQNSNFIILNNITEFTFPSSEPTSVIDMILGFRKNPTDKEYVVMERGIPTPPSGVVLKDISDHLPYCVTVDMTYEQTLNIHTVTTGNISGTGSFSEALGNANYGDIINFDFDGDSIELVDALALKSITIDGLNKHNFQPIVFTQSAANSFFSVASGVSVSLQNIIFDGRNRLANSAVVTNNGSSLTIESCEFKNINAQQNNGGALRVQGEVLINNSSFENNTSNGGYGGGAICLYNAANAEIENSSFFANTAPRGGAIHAEGTAAYTLKVVNSTIANNQAVGATNARGGGVYLACPTALEVLATFINCTITGNSALNNGGGLCAFASANKKININLINSIIAYNMTAGTKYSDIDVWNLNDRVFFTNATHCLYGAALGTAENISWTNSIKPADITSANIFRNTETWTGSFIRPEVADSNSLKLVYIASSSLARNAGVNTLAGFTIPSLDQLGNERKANPSLGAVEYTILTQVDKAPNTTIRVSRSDNVITFRGLAASHKVSVYNTSGILLMQTIVSNNDQIHLPSYQNNHHVIIRMEDTNQSSKIYTHKL